MSQQHEKHNSEGSFPILLGKSLAGVKHQLPADLEGELNLVFVAFHRRQQRAIDRWIQELGSIEDSYPGLAVYEVPLMNRFPGFYRDWIDSGMRAGIPDPKTRRRTVTVYTDRSGFLESAGLGGTSDIWVVLVDRNGTVFWSHTGEYGSPARDGLERALVSPDRNKT